MLRHPPPRKHDSTCHGWPARDCCASRFSHGICGTSITHPQGLASRSAARRYRRARQGRDDRLRIVLRSGRPVPEVLRGSQPARHGERRKQKRRPTAILPFLYGAAHRCLRMDKHLPHHRPRQARYRRDRHEADQKVTELSEHAPGRARAGSVRLSGPSITARTPPNRSRPSNARGLRGLKIRPPKHLLVPWREPSASSMPVRRRPLSSLARREALTSSSFRAVNAS